MFFYFHSSHKRSRKGIGKYKLIMKSMYHKPETIKSSSGVKELENRLSQMQWSGIPDDLYYNAWDKFICKILRTSPRKKYLFSWISARRTLRLGPEQISNNSVRFVLKKSVKTKKYSSCWYGLMHRSKKLWKRTRCPESHRAWSNLSRRRRTSRLLLNFHFTHRKRRPRSGSRAVNRRRRRLFRHGS